MLNSKESGFLYFVASVLAFPISWQNNILLYRGSGGENARKMEEHRTQYHQHCLSPLEPDLQASIPFTVNDVSVDLILHVVIQNL